MNSEGVVTSRGQYMDHGERRSIIVVEVGKNWEYWKLDDRVHIMSKSDVALVLDDVSDADLLAQVQKRFLALKGQGE